MLPTRDPPQDKRPKAQRLKVKDWKEIFQANGQEKKAGVAILISDKTDFNKKGHRERPRRSLYNTQRNNPPRRHKHCKYICTHPNTQTKSWRTSRKILIATQL